MNNLNEFKLEMMKSNKCPGDCDGDCNRCSHADDANAAVKYNIRRFRISDPMKLLQKVLYETPMARYKDVTPSFAMCLTIFL